MEIRVKIPLNMITKQVLDIDVSNFENKLREFVNTLENEYTVDRDIYGEFVSIGVNMDELDNMIEEIEDFSFGFESDPDVINFPYTQWIDRLMTIYPGRHS